MTKEYATISLRMRAAEPISLARSLTREGWGCTQVLMLGEAVFFAEMKNNKRFGDDRDFVAYRQQTSLLIPMPPSLYISLPALVRQVHFTLLRAAAACGCVRCFAAAAIIAPAEPAKHMGCLLL